MKKWFGLWIIVLLVLIVVYHEEPQKLTVLDEYEELYGFTMQGPYEEELVFANKLDEMEQREYIRLYSYDEGKSLLNLVIKGNDPVVSMDPAKQSLLEVTNDSAQMLQEKLDFVAAEMKKLYTLPEGQNIHELFDERLPKAQDADYYFFKENEDGNFYIALFFEKTGELQTVEWRN